MSVRTCRGVRVTPVPLPHALHLMLPSVIECSSFRLRPWVASDKDSLVKHANNRNIWRNLRDLFPHPYTQADAEKWFAGGGVDEGTYAIDVDGEAVGTISVERGSEIGQFTAEIGYWLGESYWGRGIVSEAVGILTDLALAEPDIVRVYAPVFAWNARSMRVLENNGFVRECVMRRAGFKDGTIIDRVIYARTRSSDHPYVAAVDAAPSCHKA
jgi:[ribosomal protein S5]-alanine N-acetyltransferase